MRPFALYGNMRTFILILYYLLGNTSLAHSNGDVDQNTPPLENNIRVLESHDSNLFERAVSHPNFDENAVGEDSVEEMDTSQKQATANIVGGTNATAGEFPFYVHVLKDPNFLCGGTLIWPDVVLTAASCERAWVGGTALVGTTKLFGDNDTEVFAIRRVSIHPLYRLNSLRNNVMLVQLAGRSEATPVTLNTDRNLPVTGRNVTVIGFGATTEGGNVSESLLKANVQVIDFATCQTQLENFTTVFPREICAGVAAGGRDSCGADDGGPLLDSVTGVQYGIVSYGEGCARPNTPSVYADVSSYSTFIERFICENSASPPQSCVRSITPPHKPGKGKGGGMNGKGKGSTNGKGKGGVNGKGKGGMNGKGNGWTNGKGKGTANGKGGGKGKGKGKSSKGKGGKSKKK